MELESDFSTGLTEDISIDESDEIDPQPIYLEYKRTSSSSWSRVFHHEFDFQKTLESYLKEKREQLAQG